MILFTMCHPGAQWPALQTTQSGSAQFRESSSRSKVSQVVVHTVTDCVLPFCLRHTTMWEPAHCCANCPPLGLTVNNADAFVSHTWSAYPVTDLVTMPCIPLFTVFRPHRNMSVSSVIFHSTSHNPKSLALGIASWCSAQAQRKKDMKPCTSVRCCLW